MVAISEMNPRQIPLLEKFVSYDNQSNEIYTDEAYNNEMMGEEQQVEWEDE